VIGTRRRRHHPKLRVVSGVLLLFAIGSSCGDSSSGDDAAVTTTAAVPDQLEQTGIDLRNAILADGIVTREEFEQAVEAAAGCLEDHGLRDVSWNAYGDLGWSHADDSSATAAAEEAVYNLCYYSYLDRLSPP
jgi:hypothetical protein